MATIQIYSDINMASPSIWYGTVVASTATQIIISNGSNETIYSGNFTYNPLVKVAGTTQVSGTLTGITEIERGHYVYVATGLNVDATTAENYIQSNNPVALLQTALAGNDQFVIKALGTHVINGFGGYNTIWEPGPSTSFVIGANGGGNENDFFSNVQGVFFTDGFLDWTTGVFSPTGGDAGWLTFQNTNGSLTLWRMSNTSIIGGGLVNNNPGPTWHVEGTGHFIFGDGNTDLVLQNDNGAVAIWGLNGSTIRGGGLISYNPGPTWHVKGTGHFYSNVASDILFQNDNGSVAIWEMSGSTIIGGNLLNYNPGPAWHIKGTGDFNSDGHTDILWQHDNGSVAIWEMNGSSSVGGGTISYNPGSAWHIKGTGDFNADGHADIVFQHDNGAVAIWEMNGTNGVGGGTVAYNPGPTWHIKATGDYNGDGHTDLAFQNDNGAVAIWEMNGTNGVGGGTVSYNPGNSWNLLDDNMQFVYSTVADETLVATPAAPEEFVLTNFSAGSHTISGFNPTQDMIEFSKTLFASFTDVQAATSVISGGAMIDLGNGSSLLLLGVDPVSLHASDFALV